MSKNNMFKVPESGFYEIQGQVTRFIPTDKFETVTNPDRRWFHFWKPKMVTRRVFDTVIEPGVKERRFLQQGESIDIPSFRKLGI